MKKKNGFTLIELLAVIIILGILMIIAIPSVTRYINDSRKDAYIKTAKQVVSGARNIVNEGKLEMYDTNVTYYIPNNCIRIENGEQAKSPYGEFTKAYVVVTYDGKGYDYYWTSVDETGMGINKIIGIDEINSDDIESDLTMDDIHNDYGKNGKFSIKVLENCSYFVNKECSNKPICIRATSLNSAVCERTDSNGCRRKNKFQTNDLITFGNLGKRGELKVGDAFDCDLNGDGNYNERFYYVSDYYNTQSKNFESDTAVLIYNSNFVNGSVDNTHNGFNYYNGGATETCNGSNYNCFGPNSLASKLPSKELWSNIEQKSQNRAILSCQNYNCDSVSSVTDGGTLESNYNYNKPARLLTLMELNFGCIKSNPSLDLWNVGLDDLELADCSFLFENTKLTGDDFGTNIIWLETPRTNTTRQVWRISSANISMGNQSISSSSYGGVRPVIDVSKSNIDY